MTASHSIHAIGVPSLMLAAASTWRVKSSRFLIAGHVVAL
jgi:hypothetical protein